MTRNTLYPTETIAQRCAKIRNEWSPEERQRRREMARVAQDSLVRRALKRRRQLTVA